MYVVGCNDNRVCFAKRKTGRGENVCVLLKETYSDGKCPFCKEKALYTNGKLYPYDAYNYGR